MATPESGPRLVVRPARADDAVALREIYNEAVADKLATFETSPRSIEEQREQIAVAVSDVKHPILVADVRNWAAGWAAIEAFGTRPALDEIGEIFIFVRRSFRRYGVGRQLMRAAQAEASRQGYRKLIGHVLGENRDSLRLCQATGWREVGKYLDHARHRDDLRDVVVVEYQVPPAAPE